MRRVACALFAVVAGVAVVGVACADPKAPVDPDSHETRDLRAEARAEASRLAEVSLDSVVGAAAGVSAREAPATLRVWLAATSEGRALLARWPRTSDGEPDLRRAPISARSVRVFVDRGSRTACGEVDLTLRGAGPPTVRLRLPLPSTARACRAAGSGVSLEGLAALDALDEAIDAGLVVEAVRPRRLHRGLTTDVDWRARPP